MSTDYEAWEDGDNVLLTDSRRRLEMHLSPTIGGKSWAEEDGTVHYSSEKLTEEQFVEIGVGILGPCFYFTDDKDALFQKVKDALNKHGYYTRGMP